MECKTCGIISHPHKDFYVVDGTIRNNVCKYCRPIIRSLQKNGIIPIKRNGEKYNVNYKELIFSNIKIYLIKKNKTKTKLLKFSIIRSLRSNHGKFKCSYCDDWYRIEDLPKYLQKKTGNNSCHSCWKQLSHKWVKENKERHSYNCIKYIKERYKTDPLFRFNMSVRSLIASSIKRCGWNKNSKTHDILGCDFETFRIHIEKQFTKGMNWDNRSEWHLDHIYPVSLAKDEQHLIELNHYTNFQPLWAIDNISKNNKIVEHQTKMPI